MRPAIFNDLPGGFEQGPVVMLAGRSRRG